MTKGLYVQVFTSGLIHAVQVDDGAGTQWSLDPDQYNVRGHKPPIDELPTLETYVRDRYLAAISAAFDDAFTTSLSGSWQVFVESTPKREIVLMPAFVARNVTGGCMQPDELTKHLQSIPHSAWVKHENGTLSLALS